MADGKNSGKAAFRRNNGEGTFYQNQCGNWCNRIQIGLNEIGKPIYKVFTAKSKKLANEKRKAYLASIGMLSSADMVKKSLADYMKFWLENIKRTEVAGPTYDSIEAALKRIESYPIAHEQIGNINSVGLQTLLDGLAEDGYSEATVRKTWEWVSNCLKYAVDTEHVPKDPTVRVHIPQAEHYKKNMERIQAFTIEEQEKVEAAALERYSTGKYRFRYGPAVVFMLHTGFRPSEMRALQWKHLKTKILDGKKIAFLSVEESIRESKNRNKEKGGLKYKVYSGQTKTRTSVREVPLNSRAETMLEIMRSQCGSYTRPEDYIVQTDTHNLSDRGNIDRCFRKILAKAQVGGRGGVNRARHTFASRMAERGVNMKATAKIMGHASPKTTMQYYVDCDQEQEYEAVNKLL